MNDNYMLPLTLPPRDLGPDKRLCHRFGGCGGLLQGVQRHRLRGQCGERTSLDAAVSSDHAAKHSGHQELARDSQRPRKHFQFHAGNLHSSSIRRRRKKKSLASIANRRSGFHRRFAKPLFHLLPINSQSGDLEKSSSTRLCHRFCS